MIFDRKICLNTCGSYRKAILLLYLQLKLQRNYFSIKNIQYLPQTHLWKKKFIVFSEQTIKSHSHAWWPLGGDAATGFPSLHRGGNSGQRVERPLQLSFHFAITDSKLWKVNGFWFIRRKWRVNSLSEDAWVRHWPDPQVTWSVQCVIGAPFPNRLLG